MLRRPPGQAQCPPVGCGSWGPRRRCPSGKTRRTVAGGPLSPASSAARAARCGLGPEAVGEAAACSSAAPRRLSHRPAKRPNRSGRSQSPLQLVEGSPEQPRPRLECCPALSALGHAALNNATPQWKTAPPISAADKRRHLGAHLPGWQHYLWELKLLASARPCHREQDLIIEVDAENGKKKKNNRKSSSLAFLLGRLSWLLQTGDVRGWREREWTEGDSHMGSGAVWPWARHRASRSASLGSGEPAPVQRGCGDVRSPVRHGSAGACRPAGARGAAAAETGIAISPLPRPTSST